MIKYITVCDSNVRDLIYEMVFITIQIKLTLRELTGDSTIDKDSGS